LKFPWEKRIILLHLNSMAAALEGAPFIPYLRAALNRFIAETNTNPEPFPWNVDPVRVITEVARGKLVV